MNKKRKVFIIIAIIVVIIGLGFIIWKSADNKEESDNITQSEPTELTQNNNTNQNTSTDSKQLLLDVMNSKEKFIDEDKNEVYFKDFKIVEAQTAEVYEYTFVDMDKDGTEELVVLTTSDYGAYVILHFENNKAYGYMIGFRSLENLKTDGSFIGSNGADSNEYLRMTFNKNSYSIIKEAVYDGLENVYKINDNDVSQKEIEEYAENWNKKEDVIWSK